MANRSIFQAVRKIEREFDEPIREVVAGFIPMGMTLPSTAETLGVDPRSLRRFCSSENIRFPANQPDRSERIRETRRQQSRVHRVGRQAYCLTELAELSGIKRTTLRMRLSRGWSMQDALRA